MEALPPADRGVRRLLFGGELDEDAAAVVPADVGVREERFRAALIRTLTVDGIFSLFSSSSPNTVLLCYVIVSIDVCCCVDREAEYDLMLLMMMIDVVQSQSACLRAACQSFECHR